MMADGCWLMDGGDDHGGDGDDGDDLQDKQRTDLK